MADSRAHGGQNQRLNLYKCVAIYAVMLVHIRLPGELGLVVSVLGRFAVPLFFLTAGLFAWERPPAVLALRGLRLLRLLVAVLAALVVLGCVLALREGTGMADFLRSLVTPWTVWTLLTVQVLPMPYAWAMWFLISLGVVYLLWWGMAALCQQLGRRVPYDLLGWLALAALALHLWLGEGRALRGLGVDPFLVRNAWLYGLPFFALGAWLGQHRVWAARYLGGRWWGACMVLASLLALVEWRLAGVLDLYLGSGAVALLLLGRALARPEVASPLLRATACRCGQDLTFYLYLIHVTVYGMVEWWRGTVPTFAWIYDRPWLRPGTVALVSTALALAVHGAVLWRDKRARKGSRSR